MKVLLTDLLNNKDNLLRDIAVVIDPAYADFWEFFDIRPETIHSRHGVITIDENNNSKMTASNNTIPFILRIDRTGTELMDIYEMFSEEVGWIELTTSKKDTRLSRIRILISKRGY